MSTKLTLSITDKKLIEDAKKYARAQNKSLSRIIEEYLRTISGDSKKIMLSPEVESLVGIMKTKKPFDYKRERDEMVSEKRSKYLKDE